MIFKLKIENTIVDLSEGSNLTLNLNSNICGSADTIKTSRSYTITCPFTDRNRTLFKYIEIPTQQNDFLTTSKNATLEIEGVFIFQGKAVLLSIGKDGYEIALFFGDLQALQNLVADTRTIAELGIPEIFSAWLSSTPYTTTKAGYGIFQYITGMDNYVPTLRKQSYAIQVQALVSLVLDYYYGINYSFETDISDDYLILAKNLNTARAGSPYLQYRQQSAVITINHYDRTDLAPNICIANYLTANRLFLTSTNKIQTMKFEIIITDSRTGSFYLVQADSNNVQKQAYPLNKNITNYVNIDTANLAAGDMFDMRYGTGGVQDSQIQVSFDLASGSSYPLSDILQYQSIRTQGLYTEMDFPLIANCDFTALELLKEVQLFNGLYCIQEYGTQNIVFKSFDALNYISDAQDLSNKFISLESTKFDFNDWAKNNLFKYTASDDEFDENYNSGYFTLPYYSLSNKKELKSIFGTGAVGYPIRLNQYSIEIIPAVSATITDSSLPIIYAKYNSGNLVSVPFQDIINSKYATLKEKLEDMKVCTINLIFTALEYKFFDKNKAFFIKQLGLYFFMIDADFDAKTGILKVNALKV